MRKTTFLIGTGLGYVLGSKAGRQRYEQIRSTAQKVMNDPKVQQKVSQVQDQATSLASKAKEGAAGRAQQRVSSAYTSVRNRRRGETTDEASYDVVELPGTYAQAGSNGRVDGLE